MTEVAQRQELEQAVPLAALFTAFLAVCLYGVGGGGIVWARRIAVENRRWINDREFADIVSLCQFMPGPNIVGIAATAAGLLIATGIRLLLPHRRRPAALLFAGLAFGLITFAKLPLLAVLFVLVPLSIAIAGIDKARAR